MKKTMWAIIAVSVLSAWAISAVQAGEDAAVATQVGEVKTQTLCPVMKDNPVNKALFVDHDGKRIYVCCMGCVAEVTKDPAKYIKQLEDEGITLDKTPVTPPPAP
ncbi:MAG: hypothetical protein V2A34_08475 [Lentisphaerota bacterium]